MKVNCYLTHNAPPDFGPFWAPETLRAIAEQLCQIADTGEVSNERLTITFTFEEPLPGLPTGTA
jgi:hypothetical protein